MIITISIICLIIVIGLLRSLYIKERTRNDVHQSWKDFDYTSNRYKLPLWLYVLAIIFCFIPVLNIIITIITIIVCLVICNESYEGTESWEKAEVRPYSKIFRAFRFLNKKI